MSLTAWTNSQIANSAGALSDKFAGVAGAFAANFEAGEEAGASFAVAINGELVVDLRGGWIDRRKETPWTDETIACVYSSGKAVMAMLIAREVGEGRLDYDAPIATWWPEFAANGKGEITLGEALSHQAGLSVFPEDTPSEIYLDWDAACAALADMAPLWTPGTQNGYHPQTIGFIAGEVLRRVTGKRVGEHLSLLRKHYGVAIHCGLDEEAMGKAAKMLKPPRAPDLGPLNELKTLAFLSPSSTPAQAGRPAWMAAEIPASNMHANARSLALFLTPLANQGKGRGGAALIDEAAVAAALRERRRGDDLVLPFNLSWSAGLMRNSNRHFGPNENAYGHAGFGGSAVLVDPDRGLTAAYVMNKMSPYLVGDPRSVRLINAVYDAL